MTALLHIASVVVQARPDRLDAVRGLLAELGGEVAGCDPAGKLAAVLEAPTDRALVDGIDRIQKLEGVVNALLVYHHAEPASSLEEVIPCP